MSDSIPHDQLVADLENIGIPEPVAIATKKDIESHIHSKVSAKIKTEDGVLIFENGILVAIDK